MIVSTKHLAILASLGLTLASSIAVAADKYAVVSAIGDELTVVTYQPSVGTRLDSNLRQVVPLTDDSFDQVAGKAAEFAIHRTVPDAEIVLLRPGPGAFLKDDATRQEVGLTDDQLVAIERSVADAGARYLVVIAKAKGDTRLAFRNTHAGQGKLFGIGFYFDRIQKVTETATGRTGRGFLSPYAYLTLTLVDLQTGTVLKTKTAAETASIATAASETEMHPWDAVPAETKVRALNGLIRRAIVETVPQVLAPT